MPTGTNRQMYITRLVQGCVTGILVFLVLGFIVSRIDIFIEAYRKEILTHENDLKIIQKCKDIEFVNLMKERNPTICQDAAKHAQKNIALTAFHSVIETTYLCGYKSCQSIILDSIDGVISHGTPMIVCIVLCAMAIPTFSARLMNSYMSHHNPAIPQYNPYLLEHNPVAVISDPTSIRQRKIGI